MKSKSLLVLVIMLVAVNANAVNEAEQLINEAEILSNTIKGIGTVPLITKQKQIKANSEQSSQFRAGNLINSSTDYNTIIFHTSWSNPVPADETNFIQVNLNEAVEQFVFRMIGSNWDNTYDTPDHVIIEATNTPEISDSWTKITEMEDLIPEADHDVHPAKYTSPQIKLGGAYTSLRFLVIATVNNRSNKNGNFYVSLARFMVLGDQPIEEAPYTKTRGMKADYDAMMAAVDAVKANPSEESIARLRTCIRAARWTLANGNYEPGKEPISVVFIGNSITAGATLSSSATQAPPVRCMEKIKKDTGRPVYYKNCGVSGSTTVNWLPGTSLFSNANKAATTFSENGGYLYFNMMLGTNDSAEKGPTGSPVSPEKYEENMKSIIRELHESNPDARFIVNYPLWYSPNTHNGATYLQAGLDRLNSYHPVIDKMVADLQADGIEIWAGSKEIYGFFEGKNEYFTAENGNSGVFYLHPNATGATYLGEFWAQTIIDKTLPIPTDVGNVEVKRNVSNNVYNLQGMRVSSTKNLSHGIYIVNGQKVAL